MIVLQSAHIALLSIARNKMRSLLTLLGVIIGVAAVIALLTIGNGAKEKIRAEMAHMGGQIIFVFAGALPDPSRVQAGPPAPLLNQHFRSLQKALHVDATVAAEATGQKRASYGSRGLVATVTGVSGSYFNMRDWSLRRGRLPSFEELENGVANCVIGSAVAQRIFAHENPIGARIRVGPVGCTIVGELTAKGASFTGSLDTVVLVPLRLFQTRLSGNTQIDQILVKAPGHIDTATLKDRMKNTLRQLRRIAHDRADDFQIEDMAELIRQTSGVIANVTAFLSAIAGISLLVGGIGIMNIMLVSVTERTREIGIRMAIGARQRDILLQFLTEASVLTLLGGLIGIALGLAIAWGVTTLMEVAFVPGFGSIAMITAISIAIGVLFGLFPALRGARLDPIEALRHE
ncbi:ABC transporter permease [Nitratireductor sp. GISD-1A_MAKvit]|uniref:ABC transporter permease n=1 Tax=Nitratireductor sp. GISD-1A_MAKvit TaxID=3234198 RepID=UPI0034652C87